MLQTFCGVSRETGRDSEADAVVTNSTSQSRPFRLGPVGYAKWKTVAVILPLHASLGPEDGFFSYCPESIHWTDQEFLERLKSNDIPMKEMRVGLHEGIVMPAELVLQFPTQRPGCHFVCKGYVPEIRALTQEQLVFERKHVAPFMRNAVKRVIIDDWRNY